MANQSTLPIGEKIRQIRKEKGLSQVNMATAIGKSQSFVNRIEQGQADCTQELLTEIKKFLGIENAPLLEHEVTQYQNRLCICNDMVIANRMTEAEIMLQEMFPVEELPYEHELIILRALVSAGILYYKDELYGILLTDTQLAEFTVVQQNLDSLFSSFDGESVLVNQLYNYIKGIYYSKHHDLKNTLLYYKKAYDIKTNEARTISRIARAIGSCYISFGKPFHAIRYLEQSLSLFSGDRSDNHNAAVSAELAICYETVGEYEKAKELYETNLAALRSIYGNKVELSKALVNTAALYNKMNKYEEAVSLLDQSIALTKDIKQMYFAALSNKLDSLMYLQRTSEFEELLQHCLSIAQGNEFFIKAFETIGHIATIKEAASMEYLEKVSIPLFYGGEKPHISSLTMLIDICKALEGQYRKKRQIKNANAIAAILRDIYEGMIFVED